MKKTTYIWILVIVIFALITINYLFFYTDYVDKNVSKYQLNSNGIQVFQNMFNDDEIRDMKNHCDKKDYKKVKMYLLSHPKLRKLIDENMGDQYIFQDYIWIIKKSVVHTCHRDNNGDFFNKGQKYPSYTMLVYLENMDKGLGVIPNSHNEMNSYNFNLVDPIINLPCNQGDVIIFNANLIHVGSMNKKDDHLRMQLKVTHKDDIKHIKYYENFNKILDNDNHLPVVLRKAQKKLSCMMPGISNWTQGENIRTARGSVDGVDVGTSQKIFSYMFYGNSKFYDLPNAF